MANLENDLLVIGAGDPGIDGRYVRYDTWGSHGRWLQLDVPGEDIQDERNQIWFNQKQWRLGRTNHYRYCNNNPGEDPSVGDWFPQLGAAPGPQIKVIDESFSEEQSVWLRRALAIGKAVAGGVKFFFEDLYNGGLQLLFLAEKWDDLSTYARVFTMMSIASGVVCSLAGPLTELAVLASLAVPKEASSENAMDLYDTQAAASAGPEHEGLLGKAGAPGAPDGAQQKADDAEAGESGKSKNTKRKLKRKPGCMVNNVSIGVLVMGGSRRSRVIHRALIIAGLLYWGSIGVLPFITSVGCGKAFPPLTFYVFFCPTIACIIIEIWVIIHCRHGYLMFKNFRLKFVLGLLFGFLGRFDSFSDVMAVQAVAHCEPISEVTIMRHRIPLPADLAKLMMFGIIVGVAIIQAVPGLIALFSKKWLPIGFKLNELCMVLAVMDDEAKNGDEGDDTESNLFHFVSKV